MLPVFIMDTIKLSHRFAGPIYRLRGVIRGLAQGEAYKPVQFREFDFWQEMAADFNTMVEKISGHPERATTGTKEEVDAGALAGK
jgi:hypothetical protein